MKPFAARHGAVILAVALAIYPGIAGTDEPDPPEPIGQTSTPTSPDEPEPPPPGVQRVTVGDAPRLLIDAHARLRIRRGADREIEARFVPDSAGTPIPPSYGFRLESDVGGVRLKADAPPGGTLTIAVPALTTVHVAHLDGELVATDLNGDFSARSRIGAIELQSHGGAIDIELQTGKVTLSRFRAENKAVNVAIGEGAVIVELEAQHPGPARVSVDRGRVELTVSPDTRANVRTTDLSREGLVGERVRLERVERVPREVQYAFRGGGARWELSVRQSGSSVRVFPPDGVRPDSIDGMKPQP